MSRYENKYLISSAARTAILPLLRSRMRPDDHGTLGPGIYTIYSIYMDTDDLAIYHEKIDGLFRRMKVRLRHYHREKGPYFLEMKERVNAQIIKTRAILSDAEFSCAVNGRPIPQERNNAAIRNYNNYVSRRRLRPHAIIGNIREAYQSSLPGELRVTFDSNITDQQCNYEGDALCAEYRTMHPQWYILEIKFDLFMPRWISDLVARFSLWNEAVCKYGFGINRLMKLGRVAEPAPLGYTPLLPVAAPNPSHSPSPEKTPEKTKPWMLGEAIDPLSR
jgi:hypothetical protein